MEVIIAIRAIVAITALITVLVGCAPLTPTGASRSAPAVVEGGAAGAATAPAGSADGWPAYRRVQAPRGTITLSGSSALATFARSWGSAFGRLYPAASVQVVAKSSGAAIGDMIANPGTIGMTSRPLTAAERDAYAKSHGAPPLELKVAIDAVAIYVFKDNPLDSISLPQLERVYSAAPGSGAAIERWGQLGATGDWAERAISPVGFDAGRGAYEIMRELVLRGGSFHAGVAAEPVSTSVVQAVGVTPAAIGYASVYYRTARTKVLAVTAADGRRGEPTEADCASGRYPLARFLYLHIGAGKGADGDAAAREFVRFVLSDEGQNVARASGAFAVPAAVAREQVAALGVR